MSDSRKPEAGPFAGDAADPNTPGRNAADPSLLDDVLDGLTAEELEALAHGREDLLDDDRLGALLGMSGMRARIESEKALSIDLGLALRDATPAMSTLDLEGLVDAALATARPAPTRPALFGAAAAAAGLTLGLSLLTFGVPSPGTMWSAVKDGLVVVRALDALVGQLVPGGWGALSFGFSLLAILAFMPVRRIVRKDSWVGPTLVVLLASLTLAQPAYALELDGDWPDDETGVTLSLDHVPRSEALRAAAASVGLGYVAHLDDDPPVSVHVENASLRDVVEAVLGDQDVVVERRARMLVVRGTEPDRARERERSRRIEREIERAHEIAREHHDHEHPDPELSVPPVPPVPPVPEIPDLDDVDFDEDDEDGALEERISFGGDVHVKPDERVQAVVTMGGDALIEGEVIGDVVTMGGDVILRGDGIVQGEVVTMGGDVVTQAGASKPRVRQAQIRIEREESHDEDGDEGVLAHVFREATKHALLFLLGLLLLATAGDRFRVVREAVARSPVRSAVTGVLGLVAGIALVVALTISIVGIPGALVVALLAPVAAYVGLVAIASVVGRLFPGVALAQRPIAQLAAGVGALFILSLVPVVGDVASAVLVVIGFGAVLLTRFGHRPVV